MPCFRCCWGWISLVLTLALTAGIVPEAAGQRGSAEVAVLPRFDSEAAIAPGSGTRVLVARPGDTLTDLLATAGIDRTEAEPALTALEPWFPARSLQPGHTLAVRQEPGGDAALLSLELEPWPGRTLVVSRSHNGWTVEEERAEQRRHLVLARGQVSGGLFDSLRAAGLPASLALNLIGTLSHELDFQRDLQPRDAFTILFERFRDPDGELLRNGDVLHAEFLVSGRRLSLWRHQTAAGTEWYDETGRSLKQTFLRTPLDGAKVSSSFGHRRHPILGFTHMHQGIDFAAPRGTPVFAAADGVVLSLGTVGGYGRLVRLRHGNGMETSYAHLSAFAPTLRPGLRVAQGDVIGRVGSSGRTTGPHLHYEIAAAGRRVNPATLPDKAAHLAGRDLVAFEATRRSLQASLSRLQPMQEVAAAE